MDEIHELVYVPQNIANSTFVDTPHLKSLFHPGEETLYLRPKRMNQSEVIAELGIVPINLSKHVSFRTVDPANWDIPI